MLKSDIKIGSRLKFNNIVGEVIEIQKQPGFNLYIVKVLREYWHLVDMELVTVPSWHIQEVI